MLKRRKRRALPLATPLDDSCIKRAANVDSFESLLEIEGDSAEPMSLQLSK